MIDKIVNHELWKVVLVAEFLSILAILTLMALHVQIRP